MEFKDITPEQKEQARACTTTEELLALAKKEGYELSDEELDAVSGGGFWDIKEHDFLPKDDYYCNRFPCINYG